MDELQSIVDAILPGIQEKTNSANSTFNLWFGGLKLIFLDEERAVFTTPTKLRKRFLNAKYKDYISDALEELIGFKVEVSIEDVEDEQKNILSEEEGSDISETPEQKKEGEDREKKIQKIIETSPSEKGSILDEYTFENFIVGPSNKFAHCFYGRKYGWFIRFSVHSIRKTHADCLCGKLSGMRPALPFYRAS